MIDKDINYKFADLERKLNASLESVREDVASLNGDVQSLSTTVTGITDTSYAEIVNIINDSSFEWSKDAYTMLGISPATVSDGNREAHLWFRQPQSAIDLENTSAKALKAVDHSTFAANEGVDLDIPRWDRINGFCEIGGVSEQWDLAYLLPNDVVSAGRTFYFQFEAMLRTTDAMPPDLQFFAEFWDDTPGQRKVIQGGNFTITGSIFGDQSGASNVKYLVIAQTDSGETAVSNTLEFTNAPATFSQNNHPRINFRGAPGFIQFDIYRLRGGAYTFQASIRNSIDGTFYDVGDAPIRVVSGFPATTATAPRAYAKTLTFVPGSIGGAGFVRHSLTIFVPTTYNATLTMPGNQWLRFGLTAPTVAARQIVLRRIGLSFSEANWSLSAEDNRMGVHSPKSTAASSAPAGNTGTGAPSPGGSGNCVVSDTLVDVFYPHDEIVERISLRRLKEICRKTAIYCDGNGAVGGRVLDVRIGRASELFAITTAAGQMPLCTFDHPFITRKSDITGTPASRLKIGGTVQRRGEKEIITAIEKIYGDFEVAIPVLEGGHVCVLGGYDSHNNKSPII